MHNLSKKNKQRQTGFTLIELLVVISIIGLLASIAIVQTKNALLASRDSVRKQNLKQLTKALELYYSNNQHYPNTGGSNNWMGEMVLGGSVAQDAWIPGLAPTYLAHLPHDPHTSNSSYGNCRPTSTWDIATGYAYTSDGVDYKIKAFCTPETIKNPCDPTDPFAEPTCNLMDWQVSTAGASSW